MNRQELEKKLGGVTSNLLRQKGYISFPDLFVALGALDPKELENWRFRRVPCLEQVIRMNLSRINFVMQKVRANSLNGNLKPSTTAYTSWGKGSKVRLRFSKSGAPIVEERWSTHYVARMPKSPEQAPVDSDKPRPDGPSEAAES